MPPFPLFANTACKITCGRWHDNLVWQLLPKIYSDSKVFITVTVTEKFH